MSTPRWYLRRPVAERAGEVARAFEQVYDRRATGVWAAPGRVNLIGEHTDYNSGLCLPIALPQRTLVAAAARDDDRVVGHSRQRPGDPVNIRLDDVGRGSPSGWGAYVAGAVAMLRAASPRPVPGLDVLVASDVPVGAGLSSSAALSCSTVLAADHLAGLDWAGDAAGRVRLAAVCVRAENEVALAATGGMDQAAALRSEAGHALLLDCRDGSVRQVPLDLGAEGLALLVIDTRAEHLLADGQYARRRAGCEAAARLLGVGTLRDVVDLPLEQTLARLSQESQRRLVRHVVTEIRRVRQVVALLGAARTAELGAVFDASHASLREDYAVSCAELDLAVRAVRAAGALGARMTGGGFGGSAIALVAADEAARVARAVHRSFVAAGLREPRFLLAEPSASGHRLI